MASSRIPRLHHTEHGPDGGLPVLSLHGWMMDHHLMTAPLEPVFAARSRPYRRLYPDLPGMGRTPAAGVRSGGDLVAAVEGYLDEHVGDVPFVLVGESYGGYLARALLERRRAQVLGLALVCPVGAIGEPAERNLPAHAVIVDELDVEPDPGFAEIAVVQTAETLARTQREVGTGLALADEAALEQVRRWDIDPAPDSGPGFERPTLFVVGRQDAVTGYADSWTLLERYPRASFAVLDGAGHNAQIDRPAVFEALVHDWLDRVEHGL